MTNSSIFVLFGDVFLYVLNVTELNKFPQIKFVSFVNNYVSTNPTNYRWPIRLFSFYSVMFFVHIECHRIEQIHTNKIRVIRK